MHKRNSVIFQRRHVRRVSLVAMLLCSLGVSGVHAKSGQTSHPAKYPLQIAQNTSESQSVDSAAVRSAAHRRLDRLNPEFIRTAHLTPSEINDLFSSAAILVVDQTTGQPLVSKNPDWVTPIASITKLMTAMVVLDSNQSLNDIITISEEDIDTLKNTRSRIPVGSTMTRETALLLSLMSSENRVAHALARHFPGGLSAFVSAMNRKAEDLGMSHTHFRDPTGLSNNNVSTARDLSKLVSVAGLYAKIREATTTAGAQVSLAGTPAVFNNTNALVNSPDWQIAVSKTGYIQEAGRCLVMQARVGLKPVSIVLLDSSKKSSRIDDAQRIKRLIENAQNQRMTIGQL